MAWATGVLVLLVLGLMVGTNITWHAGLLYSVLSLIGGISASGDHH